jgi:hypothetical protein
MPQTLPFISAARRLRNGRARRRQTPDATPVVTSIGAAPTLALADFEREVHTVREAIFQLADAARDLGSDDCTQLHVSLQIVSNELGQIERLLDQTHAAAPDAASAS